MSQCHEFASRHSKALAMKPFCFAQEGVAT